MCFWEDKTENKKTVHGFESEEALFIGIVQSESEQVRDEANEVNSVHSPLLVNDTIVPFKLDTGAMANLISLSDARNLKVSPKIRTKTVSLKVYNGKSIETYGAPLRRSMTPDWRTLSGE